MELHLVRHGRPRRVRSAPAAEWPLADDAAPDVLRLRDSGRLPQRASWHSSSEPKAAATARLLADTSVAVHESLGEAVRGAAWVDDFEATVAASLDEPTRPAHDGWEPAATTRARVGAAAEQILAAERQAGCDAVVLVGHGTAWTLLVAELTGGQPDLDAWRRLRMPDHCALDVDDVSPARARLVVEWGGW